MKEQIFVTPVSLVSEPSLDRPEPEFYDMLAVGDGFDNMVQSSLQDLMELNTGGDSEKNFRMEYNRRNLKFFSPRSSRSKIPIAS